MPESNRPQACHGPVRLASTTRIASDAADCTDESASLAWCGWSVDLSGPRRLILKAQLTGTRTGVPDIRSSSIDAWSGSTNTLDFAFQSVKSAESGKNFVVDARIESPAGVSCPVRLASTNKVASDVADCTDESARPAWRQGSVPIRRRRLGPLVLEYHYRNESRSRTRVRREARHGSSQERECLISDHRRSMCNAGPRPRLVVLDQHARLCPSIRQIR